MQDQVILSCSHTFHAACITSFERFLRKKGRTCPICRHSDYQKKVTSVGAMAKRMSSARVAQSIIRMHLSRKMFKRMLREWYSLGEGDKGRRHQVRACLGDLVVRVARQAT